MNAEFKARCVALLHCLDKRVVTHSAVPLREAVSLNDEVADLWQSLRDDDFSLAFEVVKDMLRELCRTRTSYHGMETSYAEAWDHDTGIEAVVNDLKDWLDDVCDECGSSDRMEEGLCPDCLLNRDIRRADALLETSKDGY